MGVFKKAVQKAADKAEDMVLGKSEKQVKSVEDAVNKANGDKGVTL